MESARTTPAPRPWIALALIACLGAPGCARMRTFRGASPPPPMLGREAPDLPERMVRSDAAASGVTLAGAPAPLRSRGSAPPRLGPNTVVRSTAPPSGAAERAPVGDDAPAQVALQPPRPVAVASATDAAPSGSRWTSPATTAVPPPASPPRRDPAQRQVAATNPAPAPAAPSASLEDLIATARVRLDALTSYQVRMNRQERVGETLQPVEDVILSIRRRPQAVRIEWPDGPNKGREVIYAANPDGSPGQMHIRMPSGLVPRLSMAPNSRLALSNSRHPITEAGLDVVVAGLEEALQLREAGDPAAGRLSDGGPKAIAGFDGTCPTIVRVKPDGETWTVAIDPRTGLPAMVEATAPDGGLLERYYFRDVRPDLPELAAADAFDPDARWGGGGLLGRLARGSDDRADAPR